MRIITWGTGNIAEKVFANDLKNNVEIVAVVDNNKEKWGNKFHGIIVIPPQDIKNYEFDKVLVLVLRGGCDIHEQLIGLGVEEYLIEHVKSSIELEYFKSTADDYFDISKKEFVKWERKKPINYTIRRAETYKSKKRREREGFFSKYCQGEGLDIGWGGDLLASNCYVWDIENGDAQFLDGIDDESFDFVYSSHCLEHMKDVCVAIRNWFRVVKHGGYLIIAVPHRDLYEKKSSLPSRFNMDHKHMFLIGDEEKPDTLDIVREIKNSIRGYEIEYVKKCDEGHTIDDPMKHSDGEYQIELVVKKK